jgi:TPR repeat protein
VLPGDRVEARKYYEKANEYVAKGMLEIAVTNYSRSNRALACRKSGRFDQARRNLQSACALKHRRACEMLAEMKGNRK